MERLATARGNSGAATAGNARNLRRRLAGSADLFERQSRRPWASINYAASHDGFTLADAVSFKERHNEANREDNRDGQGENYSSDWGVEGPTTDAALVEIRGREVRRAMLATVMFAEGTPMLLAGDKFGRTQRGKQITPTARTTRFPGWTGS